MKALSLLAFTLALFLGSVATGTGGDQGGGGGKPPGAVILT